MSLPATHPIVDGRTTDAPLVAAYRGRRVAQRPIWMMRQAGRSLPEYRAAREGISMLDSCLMPELAAELTCQPVRRHRVDAAVYFSDIVVPLKLAGVGVEIVAGVGPVMDHPVRSAADVRALPELDPAALAPIRQAVGRCVDELGTTPLVGFGGAPYTVASYLVEGGPSRDHAHAAAMRAEDPAAWHALLAWVARTTCSFMRAQGEAGASALQLFDSWVGRLSEPEYVEFVQPHSAAVLAGLADLGVPRVHFGTGTGHLLPQLRAAGADVVGVDAATPLDEASRVLGPEVPLQGNIDPELLSARWADLEAHVREVLERGSGAAGHVVNLGHGVPKDANPEVLTRVVELVHSIPDQAATMASSAVAP